MQPERRVILAQLGLTERRAISVLPGRRDRRVRLVLPGRKAIVEQPGPLEPLGQKVILVHKVRRALPVRKVILALKATPAHLAPVPHLLRQPVVR